MATMTMDIGATYIKMYPSDQTTLPRVIRRDQVTRINPTYSLTPPKYKHTVQLAIDIFLSDDSHELFDIQDITNQAGWTANLTGLIQAMTDLTA